MTTELPLNRIIHGDCLEVLATFPEKSIDLIFADPPYNLQLQGELWRPNQTYVDSVDDSWDQFESYSEYDQFTCDWLQAVRRVMKSTSSLWVSGTYHNIFRVGNLMQNMGFWLLNTVVWYRPNSMPNFNGTRLKNDVEFIIWAKKSQDSKYHFNYQLLKQFNDGKQLGSQWQIPICASPERLVDEHGKKIHSTQKPEALLQRILLASGKPNLIALDPFSGTGTTAAVAKRYHMHWIGIEREEQYVNASRKRLENTQPISQKDKLFKLFAKPKPPKVAFKKLIEHGYLHTGQSLFLHKTNYVAEILPDSDLRVDEHIGSIHMLGKELLQSPSCNGWKAWQYEAEDGAHQMIDVLRQQYRREVLGFDG